MAISQYQWRTQVQRQAMEESDNARAIRNLRTERITVAWKTGFKTLKDENDRLQKERDEEYKQEIARIQAWMKLQLTQGPPK